MSPLEIPTHVTFEQTQVARYRAFEETAGGFQLPSTESSDRHVFFTLPGVTALPAVIFYRTRHTGLPAFSVRLNDAPVTRYAFVAGDEAERSWHEIVPASTNGRPTLRETDNELVFFARDGSVVFGDIVLLYTSHQTTVPVTLTPTPELTAD